jgi:hypothetical protein
MTRSLPASEFAIHCGIAKVLRMLAAPGVIWTHFPAGEIRDARTGAKLKHMGVRAGVADFIVIIPTPSDRPLLGFLEVKTERGRLSPAQELFRDDVAAAGCLHSVARSIDEGLNVLGRWGALTRRAQTRRDEERRRA